MQKFHLKLYTQLSSSQKMKKNKPESFSLLSLGSLTPLTNIHSRLSPRIFKKNRNDPNGILRALIYEKTWSRKSRVRLLLSRTTSTNHMHLSWIGNVSAKTLLFRNIILFLLQNFHIYLPSLTCEWHRFHYHIKHIIENNLRCALSELRLTLNELRGPLKNKCPPASPAHRSFGD